MVDYYLNNAITLEVTPTRIPEINGPIERTNGVVVTKTRIIIYNAKVPPTL